MDRVSESPSIVASIEHRTAVRSAHHRARRRTAVHVAAHWEKLARVWKALHPNKPAIWLKDKAHCGLRKAEYMLAGRPWTGEAVRAELKEVID